MNVLTGFSSQLTTDVKKKLFKYRYDVFIDALGWELETPLNMEVDQFDHDGTLYVVAKNKEEDVIGCARLLPTTESYLLEEVFPELLNGQTAPKSPDVWEVSRFTNLVSTQNELSPSIGNGGQISELSFTELLKATIQCAKKQGAKRLISVSPIGIEKLLRKAGIRGNRLGPAKVINNHAIIACWIDVD